MDLGALAYEFESVRLGDLRLETRLLRIVEAMGQRPSASLPDIFEGDPSQLEAMYRFVNNDAVEPAELLRGHQDRTVARCMLEERVLVIHDSSEFAFSGDREGLYALKKGQCGFLGHFSLAVSADGKRRPLGVLGYQTVDRKCRAEGSNWLANYKDPEKESLRWGQGAAAASKLLGKRAIHVMDREADSFELFDQLIKLGADFVVRLAHDRRIEGEVDPDNANSNPVMSDALGKAPARLKRTVPLSRRTTKTGPKGAAKHPPREERTADLEVAVCELRVRRPHHDKTLSEQLVLRVVHVREPNPPAGETAVSWRLITTLPTGTDDELAAVVDHYRARWIIEEYFKAIKTGCAFSQRQGTTRAALVNTLALTIPVAWRLLVLRGISRQEPTSPAEAVLSAAEVQVLGLLKPGLPLNTAHDACMAIAKLGGHLKSNGPPGWLVLGRGFERFNDMFYAFQAALRDQALPEAGTK